MVVVAKNVLKSAGKKTVHLVGNCIKVPRNDTAKIINFISCDGDLHVFLRIELLHVRRLHLIGYINIRLHRLVVAVACPLHHHAWRYSLGKRSADEGASSAMGSDKFVFGLNLVHPAVSLIVCGLDRLIDTCQFAKRVQPLVHLLIADDWQHLSAWEMYVRVFGENCL